MLEGDSAEYEYISEAVALSKDVEGLLVEIGLRAGMGTKTIIDACLEHRPDSTVISIDPFGSIPYEHREGQICRLDYTDDMYKQVLADMSAYAFGKNVLWIPFKETDDDFFDRYYEGVPLYDFERKVCNKYAMAHLDGPHGGTAIMEEITWFNSRMEVGATIVIDDVSPDFVDFEPIHEYLTFLNWKQIKIGNKKALYQKL